MSELVTDPANVKRQMYARIGTSFRKPGDPRSDAEVDRDRIVHSHAFRRLQRKTQIVGPSTWDFFRTRLTHTIECAQLGRAIVNRLNEDGWESAVPDRRHLVDLIDAACLAHDLGHPPFGHTGEESLDQVMRQHCDSRFEGNAQSFRIVTLLEPKKYNRLRTPVQRPLGLDLTRATLRAMTKYPWTERDERAAATGKFGCYDIDEDRECFDWVWQGDAPRHGSATTSDILEAADDLAYAVHDLEDGIWAGYVPIGQLARGEEWAVERVRDMARRRTPGLFAESGSITAEIDECFGSLRDEGWANRPFDHSRTSEGELKSFCSRLTDELISAVTAEGRLQWSADSSLARRIAMLKAVVWVWMIDQPALVTMRYGQRRILRELFEAYLEEPGMLPYQDEWSRVAERGQTHQCRFICDYVSSLTDAQAIDLHAQVVRGGH